MRRCIRSRQVVGRVDHLGRLAFGPRQCLQREFKSVGGTQVNRAEVFTKSDLSGRRRACGPLGRTHPGMHGRRVVRMHGHPLDHLGHLIGAETREQDSLQRVAIDATPQQPLFRASRHAYKPLRIGELHGEFRGACYLVELQIHLGRLLRRHVHRSLRQLISYGPYANRVISWFQSLARKAVLALGVAHHPGGDGGAHLLCTDDHTLHRAFRSRAHLACQR